MLWLLVVCVGVALGQEVTDEVLDNINEPTGISLKYGDRGGGGIMVRRVSYDMVVVVVVMLLVSFSGTPFGVNV